MNEPPAPDAPAVLVPPRPNLGPEPLPRWSSTTGLIVALGLGVLLALVVFGAYRARRRRRRDRPRTKRAAEPGIPAGPFATRREQMSAWSAAVREVLAARFGAPWRARTTEEVAADASLAEALGPDLSTRLAGFLAEADRAKFDDRDGLQPPPSDPLPDWLVAFVLPSPTPDAPAAGARSRIKGK